jgi:16S rRNA (adenine1518-N6/adenine1519-N6)-dimethyltransferase
MKPKKRLGQHFLRDETIAKQIVEALECSELKEKTDCLEIGPGQGVLTKYLLKKENCNLKLVEYDEDAVDYLKKNFKNIDQKIIQGDILKIKYSDYFRSPMYVIGNLPYNITGPIFFQILENRDKVHRMVAMIQKEVADRIASPPGSKVYGILSVLLQSFYKIEYLFSVEPDVFFPPPKVRSAVIRLTKLDKQAPIDNWLKFKNVVKAAFNQRRKTLKNALSLYDLSAVPAEILQKRAERLSVEEFIYLSKIVK